MKLPKSFNIRKAKYKVKKIPLSGLYGYCNRQKKEIVISADCPKDMLRSTLVHEVIEAILHEYSLTSVFGDDTREMICEILDRELTENFDIRFK